MAVAVRDLLAEQATWEGTSTNLLEVLAERVGERVAKSRSWPKSGRGISSELRRVAPALRAVGIEIASGRRTPDKKRARILVLSHSESGRAQPSGPSDRPNRSNGEDFPPDGSTGPDGSTVRPSGNRPLGSPRDRSRSDGPDGPDGSAPSLPGLEAWKP